MCVVYFDSRRVITQNDVVGGDLSEVHGRCQILREGLHLLLIALVEELRSCEHINIAVLVREVEGRACIVQKAIFNFLRKCKRVVELILSGCCVSFMNLD